MCPHATKYVYSCYYICVLMLLDIVLMLLYMCPHATIYVSSCYYICVLMLLYMCPHILYMQICVLMPVWMRKSVGSRDLSSFTQLYYYNICVLMLRLRMCPQAWLEAQSLGSDVLLNSSTASVDSSAYTPGGEK